MLFKKQKNEQQTSGCMHQKIELATTIQSRREYIEIWRCNGCKKLFISRVRI